MLQHGKCFGFCGVNYLRLLIIINNYVIIFFYYVCCFLLLQSFCELIFFAIGSTDLLGSVNRTSFVHGILQRWTS